MQGAHVQETESRARLTVCHAGNVSTHSSEHSKAFGAATNPRGHFKHTFNRIGKVGSSTRRSAFWLLIPARGFIAWGGIYLPSVRTNRKRGDKGRVYTQRENQLAVLTAPPAGWPSRLAPHSRPPRATALHPPTPPPVGLPPPPAWPLRRCGGAMRAAAGAPFVGPPPSCPLLLIPPRRCPLFHIRRRRSSSNYRCVGG
eukprot:1182754-Prorocentrum_minimum.AAC.2